MIGSGEYRKQFNKYKATNDTPKLAGDINPENSHQNKYI
jgi:hypothetical protein